MRPRRVTVYLAILAVAVLMWVPLFPLLFSFEEETASRAVSLLKAPSEIVYFGDSVITTTTGCEIDHRAILEMLPDDIRSRTGGFNSPGYTPVLWRSAARFFAGRGQGRVHARSFRSIWGFSHRNGAGIPIMILNALKLCSRFRPIS